MAGRRVSVRQIATLVIDGGLAPVEVADQLDLSLAEVHLALAYYYANPDELADVLDRHEERMAEARTKAIDPPETTTR